METSLIFFSRSVVPLFFVISVPGNSPTGRGLFSSLMAHLSAMSRETAIKNTPQLLARYLFGAPSGTRTQDPLIKSQLLSQVASSRGVENSVTSSDSGFYIYGFKLCCF